MPARSLRRSLGENVTVLGHSPLSRPVAWGRSSSPIRLGYRRYASIHSGTTQGRQLCHGFVSAGDALRPPSTLTALPAFTPLATLRPLSTFGTCLIKFQLPIWGRSSSPIRLGYRRYASIHSGTTQGRQLCHGFVSAGDALRPPSTLTALPAFTPLATLRPLSTFGTCLIKFQLPIHPCP